MKITAFLPLAVVAIIACDKISPSEGFVGTPPLKIAGSWTYKFDVIDSTMMATCQTRGTISFAPTAAGDQFSGAVNGLYSCMNGGESTGDVPAIVPVTFGELAGQAVRFIAFGCIHLGAVSGNPPNHFIGNLNCTFPVSEFGPTRPFSGTWEATR